MMRALSMTIASAAMLTVSACAGMTPSEQNALIGAGVGGAAGGLIGDDAGSAALGAVVGAGAGYYLGCRQEGRCGAVAQQDRRAMHDQRSGRYYFRDSQSGRYFYENGEPYPG